MEALLNVIPTEVALVLAALVANVPAVRRWLIRVFRIWQVEAADGGRPTGQIIRDELRVNDGQSVKDAVNRIESKVDGLHDDVHDLQQKRERDHEDLQRVVQKLDTHIQISQERRKT